MEEIIKSEVHRVKECLDISTLPLLIASVRQILVSDVSQEILNHNDFEMFMEQERIEDLKRISDLFKKVDSEKNPIMNSFKMRWRNYIQQKGERMLNDEELAKKGFKAIEDFITYRQQSVALV